MPNSYCSELFLYYQVPQTAAWVLSVSLAWLEKKNKILSHTMLAKPSQWDSGIFFLIGIFCKVRSVSHSCSGWMGLLHHHHTGQLCFSNPAALLFLHTSWTTSSSFTSLLDICKSWDVFTASSPPSLLALLLLWPGCGLCRAASKNSLRYPADGYYIHQDLLILLFLTA